VDIFNRKKVAELEKELANAKEQIKICNKEISRLTDKQKNDEYDFDSVRKKIIQDKDLARSVYVSRSYFMSWYEHRLYKLLCEITVSEVLKEYGLVVFAEVRLADIVKRWEDSYNSENSSDCSTFIKAMEKNSYKRSVNLLFESKKDFNNRDFDELFLYPLLRSHVDFLICRTLSPNTKDERFAPLMVIELFGQEHFDSGWSNRRRQENDEFKRNLFEATSICFDNSLKNETLKDALKDNNKLISLKSELQGKILGAIRNDDYRKKSANSYNKKMGLTYI